MKKKDRDKKIESPKAWAEIYLRDKFKTAAFHPDEEPYFYFIHTRVNYLTSCLWLKWRNEKVNGKKGFVKLSDKADRANWLIYVRNFKRDQERKIKILDYLEERKNRIADVEKTVKTT